MPSKAHHPDISLITGSIIGALIIVLLLLWPVVRLFRQHGITPEFISNILLGQPVGVNQSDDRMNVLILGTPGGTAEGFDLTDTMLFVSVHVRENDGFLLSVPRDVWVPSLSEKINAAYHRGEEQRHGNGLSLTKTVAEEVLGQPIHYALRLDFSGFTRIIDAVGGADITVEQPIDDQFFPIPGRENDTCDGDPALRCRYEHVRFDPGPQHMDGTTALKYVRSRQSVGTEGTDFSRSKRQQQMVLAVKTKLLSYRSWQHRARLYSVFNELRYATETDMNLSELFFFFRRFSAIPDTAMRRALLDEGDEKTNRPGVLVHPPLHEYYGAWVLIPRTGTFDEIHEYISCHLKNPSCQFQL